MMRAFAGLKFRTAMVPFQFQFRCRRFRGAARRMASSSSLSMSGSHEHFPATIEGRVATVTMSKAPVNTFDKGMFTGLRDTVKMLEQRPDVDGMILTSASRNVFSAGIDITKLIGVDEASFKDFWGTFEDMWATLYATPLATVARGKSFLFPLAFDSY